MLIEVYFGWLFSSVCGSTWDFICYIENFCMANLLKMAMVLVLSYIGEFIELKMLGQMLYISFSSLVFFDDLQFSCSSTCCISWAFVDALVIASAEFHGHVWFPGSLFGSIVALSCGSS